MHRTSLKSFITPNLWSIIAIALVFTSTIAARSNANAAPTLASPQPPGVEYLGNVGGSIKAIATNGNYILLLEGNFVKSLRLETDGSMTVLAKRDIGNGSAIHLVGTRAYVQTDTSVVVIDWSNPTAIPILGTYAQNNLIATAAVGTSLYLLYYISSDNYDNGVDTVLAVLDATNPAAVTVQGSTTFITYEVYGFIVHNQRAYVLFASSQVSLATYDVASPTSPTLLGTSILDLGNNIHPPRSLVNMAVTGTMLYMVIEGSAALIGFDISNPASIIQRASVTINDSYTPHITIHNTRAYVTNSVWPYMSDFPSHYLDIYDLTDPTTLPHLGRYRLSTDAHDIVVDGTRAYVALTRGVQVVDISNPAELTITHQLKTMGPVSRIVPHSDKVYTLGEQVAQIDISNPLQPHVDAFRSVGPYPIDLAVDADAVYVVDGSGILRFITTETGFGATQRISYPNSFGSETIAVDDRGIYVIGYNGLLTVFDKASGNNFSIQLDSNYNNSNFNPTMFIVGTRLYTGNLIIDISNLAQPTQVGTLPSGNVRVVGNTAFVGMKVQVDQDTWAGELHILDVTNPATPVVRGVYRTCSSPINSYFFTKVEVIHATPSEVTINTCNGAELLNVANLNQPQRIAKLGKSIQAVDGDLLYSIDGDSLSIHRIRRDLFPTTGVVTPSGGSIANVTNSVQLIFPPNAVTNNTSVIYSGLVTPSTPLGGGIAGLLHFTLTATQMNDTIPVTQFNQSYTMTITYTDAQIAGLDETSLTVMYWNGSTWINMLPCAGCSVDTVNNRITIIADHFTEFAVVGNRLVQENVVFLPLVQK